MPLSACKIQDEILDVSWGLPSARKGSQTDLRAEAKAFPAPVRDNLVLNNKHSFNAKKKDLKQNDYLYVLIYKMFSRRNFKLNICKNLVA